MHILKKIFLSISILILFIFVCLYLYLQYQVVVNGDLYTPRKSDCIIILGHSMENSNMPSDWLLSRLETGLSLYKNGFSDKIIVTGGRGPTDSEAVALSMRQWLVNKGVPESSIITETHSKNTYENFLFSKMLNETQNVKCALIVTNDFHMYRSMYIAKNFFDNVCGKSADIPLQPRKILAYIKEPFSFFKVIFNFNIQLYCLE